MEDFYINEVKHSLQQRVVFFEQIGCKTHFLARYSYHLENREFLTQHDAKHRFQQRVIFLERIWCKTHFLASYRYNFAKGTFSHKMKWKTVWSSELYSLSRFDAKRIFEQDILQISQKEDFNLKWRETQFAAASCIL